MHCLGAPAATRAPAGGRWHVFSPTHASVLSGHRHCMHAPTPLQWGKTMALVSEAGDDETPLQEQLTDVAAKVSKM